jgi:hypothetical protein
VVTTASRLTVMALVQIGQVAGALAPAAQRNSEVGQVHRVAGVVGCSGGHRISAGGNRVL